MKPLIHSPLSSFGEAAIPGVCTADLLPTEPTPHKQPCCNAYSGQAAEKRIGLLSVAGYPETSEIA